MYEPLVWLTVSFALGIRVAGLVPAAGLWPATAALPPVAYLWVCRGRNKMRLSAAATATLFFLAGWLIFNLNAVQTRQSALAAARGRKLTITGVVASKPKQVRGRLKFEFEVQFLIKNHRRRRLVENVLAAAGTEAPPLKRGARLKLRGRPRVLPTRSRRYRRYLKRRGINVLFSVENGNIDFLNKSPGYQATLRRRLRRLINSSLPPPLNNLESAILFGETEGVSQKLKNNFQRAGIYHLFAVSGLNMTLIVGFVFLVGRFLNWPPFLRLAAGIATAVFYYWLVGYTASVGRAAIMVVVTLSAWYSARKTALLSTLSLAALILLALDPRQLFAPSFQLSFSAVAGIVVIAPAITDAFKPELRHWVQPAATAAAAQIATAPLLAYYFNQLSVVGVVANLVLVPPVTLITSLGFSAILAAFIYKPAAAVLLNLSRPLLRFLNSGAALFAALPGAARWLAGPSGMSVIAYFILVGLGVAALRRRRGRHGFSVLIISLLLLTAIGIWSQVPAALATRRLTVTFLDVGQGDAILIRGPQNQTILIDGGPDYGLLRQKLAAHSVRKIDLLVLSHAHSDHVTGLVGVINNYPVGLLLDPGFPHTSPIYHDFLRAVKRRRLKYRLGRKNQLYKLGPLKLRLYMPGTEFIAGSNSDVNNSSIVMRLTYGRFHVLLPGDIEREAIKRLLRQRRDLRSQVLKVSHHSSYTGTTAALLRAVKPRAAVISVGKYNIYGHPHRSTLRRLRRAGVDYWRTDEHGDIEIRSDGDRWRLRTAE